jgi:hypothetical protein
MLPRHRQHYYEANTIWIDQIGVETKNLWIKQYFRHNKSNRWDLTDIAFKLSIY